MHVELLDHRIWSADNSLVLALVRKSFKRPLTLVLRSCRSRLSRTKQTEMTTLRFTQLHLKTGQKRHSDAAGENQNTTNSEDSKCQNGSCVNFLLCSFQLLVWDEKTVAIMAGFSFRLIAIPRSAWGSPLPSWPADTFMAPRG